MQRIGAGIFVLAEVFPEITKIVTYDDLWDNSREEKKDENEIITGQSEYFSEDEMQQRYFHKLESERLSAACGNPQEQKAKLHHLFRVFLRILSSAFGPLVMVLDDLQWAAFASLELMDVY